MQLHEHPDFAQALLRAALHPAGRGLTPAALEKDYFVTEALRRVAEVGGSRVLFKGGTSLSKGWNLIARFSEDIDLFLDPDAFEPALRRKGIDREGRRLSDAVAEVSGLRLRKDASRTFGGVGRSDVFEYEPVIEGVGELAPRVLLEIGTASGREPWELRPIQSYVGEFLEAAGATLGALNVRPFSMRVLHFRRTFVEKLFAIHGKVALMGERGAPLGSYARHYYDLYVLAGTPEVRAMLASSESERIRFDYDRLSRAQYPRDYRPPEGLRFSQSVALFPGPQLEPVLRTAYERQVRLLCFGAYPTWQQVRGRFEELRALL